MSKIYFILFLLLSLKTLASTSEIDKSYSEALHLIKSESIAPPIASYLMSEASTVAFKAFKETRDEKAYTYSFLSILKLYYPTKDTYFKNILSKIELKEKNKQLSIKLAEKRFNFKKDSYLKALNSSYSQNGTWIPTFPTYSNALLPHWGESSTNVKFNYGYLFKDLPVLDITSKSFKQQVEDVKKIGSKNSSVRTVEQTEIAQFWAAGKGSITPPGMWTEISLKEVKQVKDFYHQAFIMKNISNSLMDAAIVCWNLKYRYNLLRPITAIRELDSNWESLLITPNFPSFTSGHSTFSATASIILNSLFNSKNVKISSEGFNDRVLSSYIEAAKEAGVSRIYGGIHYPMDNSFGLNVGFKIGCTYLKEKFNTKCKAN